VVGFVATTPDIDRTQLEADSIVMCIVGVQSAADVKLTITGRLI
jgi:hypothetical protein